MEATNGHRCIVVTYNGDFELRDHEGTSFICPRFKVLASSVRVEIKREGGAVTVTQWNKRGDERAELLKVIDGRFPDVERIMADPSKCEAVDRVAFNPVYLADVTKALGAYACTINLNGQYNHAAITWADLDNVQYTIMPVRV